MSMYQAIEDSMKEKYAGWKGVSHFEGTAKRLERLADELCWSSQRIEEEIEGHFKAVTEDSYDELLVAGPINVWTLCPHHLLPCSFTVHVGYIPFGKVLGLSKFGRVALALGKRPVIQEQYTQELADTIQLQLGPLGVGVHVVGEHGCMKIRGLTQPTKVTTSVLRGVLMHGTSARAEFYSIIQGQKR